MSLPNPYLVSDGSGAGRSLPATLAGDRERLTDRAELTIGGVPWDDHAADVQFENSGEEGASTLTFVSSRPLRSRVDDEVVLTLDGEPYFTGTLKRPGKEAGSRYEKLAVALGPFAEMAGQFFTERADYNSYTLRGGLLDIFSKATDHSGYGDVIGGENITLQEAIFTEDTTLSEGARNLISSTNFVLLDKKDGEKLAMRRPRPGGAGAEVAFYTPEDYAEGDFEVDWTATQPFVKVVIFRRNEGDTGYDVYAPRDVIVEGSKRPPKKRRVWYITDWPGDQEDADAEATQLARELMHTGKFSLTVRLKPRPYRFDSFAAQQIDQEDRGPILETIDLVATDGLSADFSGETMTLTGDALLRASERFDPDPGDPPAAARSRNPYLVTP